MNAGNAISSMKPSAIDEFSKALDGLLAAHKMLQVSSLWFGLTGPRLEYRAKELNTMEILGALMDGKIVYWQDWTIRPTPPRYVLTSDGEEAWIPSLWVSSRHGFTTFVWSNQDCIENVCRYIRKKEVMAVELAMADDSDDEAF